MSNNNRPGWKPYLEYLQRLHEQRRTAGEPPGPDIFDDKNWEERRKHNSEKDK